MDDLGWSPQVQTISKRPEPIRQSRSQESDETRAPNADVDGRGRMLAEVTRRARFRPRPWVVVSVVAIATSVLVSDGPRFPSARPAQLSAVQVAQLGASEDVNPRWAGYVVANPKIAYTSATGTWIEPHVTCSPGRSAGSLSATWIGLGGYSAGSTILAQAGVDANCNQVGEPTYGAWFELLPDVAHPFGGRIEAGDTITATVSMVKDNLVELQIENHTQRWTGTRMITWSLPDESTAEWIIEAPYSCLRFTCMASSLSDFGSVSLYDISAVGNGLRGNLATPGWSTTPLDLAACGSGQTGSSAQAAPEASAASGAGAAPSRFSPDGSQFHISWVSPVGAPKVCPPNRPIKIGGTPTNW
jgi:hypothetical protein